MNNDIFNIDDFNVISDDKNYYFFRALNNADNTDIEDNITLGLNGEIISIRTDLSRYDKKPKYNAKDELSLEQIFDHVKVHHRLDTNCISLSTDANVSLLYGRGYYKDKYVLVKVPKDEMGNKVINVGQYMIREVNKRINYLINAGEISNDVQSCLSIIDNLSSNQELDEVVKKFKSGVKKEIIHENKDDNLVNYFALSDRQNLEKNKLFVKLDLINKNIISNVPNQFLAQTIDNAFSSLEIIHYGSIDKNKIIELPKEMVDVFSLIQQLPQDVLFVNELKQEVLKHLLIGNYNISKSNIDSYCISDKDNYKIDKMYKLIKEKIDYFDIINLYKKSFYLSKSKLKVIEVVNILRDITNNNAKYQDIFSYLLKKTYGVEPEIFSKLNTHKMKVNEVVNLNFSQNEKKLFDVINELDVKDLNRIISDPLGFLKYYLDNFKKI